ncbi:hypothetical protein P8452_05801 [Trifolium repens]|nr:hypothetical protein P8452_02952 [Trifolium repens]WJX15690.1 hypothetical protein P8452_05801 [Trifolium repens]
MDVEALFHRQIRKGDRLKKPYSTANSDPGEAKQKVPFSIESLAYFQTHPKAPGSILKRAATKGIRFSSTWRCNHKPSNLSTTPV